MFTPLNVSGSLTEAAIIGLPRAFANHWPLILASVIIVAAGAWLTISPVANTLGVVPLPPLYWLYLTIMLLGYAILTQLMKTWFIRRFGK